jgi:hypothetical protein
MVSEKVRIGTVLMPEDMPQMDDSSIRVKKWEDNNGNEVGENGYVINGETTFQAICTSVASPSLNFINCVDIGRHTIEIINAEMNIYDEEYHPYKTHSITFYANSIVSPDNPSGENSCIYVNPNLFPDDYYVEFVIKKVETDDGCVIYDAEGNGTCDWFNEVARIEILNNGVNVGKQVKIVFMTDIDCSCSNNCDIRWLIDCDDNSEVYHVDRYVCVGDYVYPPSPDPYKEGWKFDGWNDHNDGKILNMPLSDEYITDDKVIDICAKWTQDIEKFNVIFYVNGEKLKSYNIQSGEAVTAPTIEEVQNSDLLPEGNVFGGKWRINDAVNGQELTTDEVNELLQAVTANYNFYAVLTSASITVSFDWNTDPEVGGKDINGDDIINPADQTVTYGGSAIPPESIPVVNGFTFEGWHIYGEETVEPISNDEISEIILYKDTSFIGVWLDTNYRSYKIPWRIQNYTDKRIISIGVKLGASYGNNEEVIVETNISSGGGIDPYNDSTGKPGERSLSDLLAGKLPAVWDTIYGYRADMVCSVDGVQSSVTLTRESGKLISHSSRGSAGNYLPYIQSYVGTDVELIIELHDDPKPVPHTLLFKVMEENGSFERTVTMRSIEFVDSYTVVSSDIPSAGQIISVANNGNSGMCSFTNGSTTNVTWLNNDNPLNKTISGDAIFTAVVMINKFQATFVWTIPGYDNYFVKGIAYGEYATPPDETMIPEVDDMVFEGWDPDPSITPIVTNTVFYAQWSTVEHGTSIVTFRVEENGSPDNYWEFPTITVENGSQLSSEQVPNDNEIVEITGNERKYEFDSWVSVDTPVGQMISEDTTFTAKVTIKKYNVTFVDNGVSDVQQYGYGSNVDMPQDPVRENLTFDGWLCDDDDMVYRYGDEYDFVSKNLKFTAIWMAKIRFRVKDDETGETWYVADKEKTVTVPYTLTDSDIPTVSEILSATGEPSAFNFEAWDNSTYGNPSDYGDITRDITFTAIISRRVITVTFMPNNGAQNSYVTVDYGGSVTIPDDPLYDGHTFNGWLCSVDGNTYTQGDIYDNITQDISFSGQWEDVAPTMHTVTFVFGHDIDNIVTTVEDGNTVTPPTAPSVEGYLFDGWDSDPNVPITQDMTFTAIWKIRVIFKAEGSIIDTQYVPNNGHVTIPNVTVGTGRRFKDKWTKEGHTTQYANDTVIGWDIQEPLVLVAVVVDVYTVEFYADTTKIGGTHTVESGNKITPPTNSAIDSAISGTGKVRYESGGWRIANSDGAFDTYSDVYTNDWFTNNGITSNMKFYARLAYKVIFDFNQDGYDDVEQYIEQGHHASVPSVPSIENCEFTGWGSSVSGLNTGDNITANVTFTAQWECNEEPQKVKYNIPYCIINGSGHEINTITVWVNAVTGSESKICETSMGGGIISGTHCRSDFYSDAFPENWDYITYEKCVADISTVGLVEIDTWNVSHSYKTDSTGTYKLYVDGVYYNPDTHPSQSSDASFNIHIDKIQ